MVPDVEKQRSWPCNTRFLCSQYESTPRWLPNPGGGRLYYTCDVHSEREHSFCVEQMALVIANSVGYETLLISRPDRGTSSILMTSEAFTYALVSNLARKCTWGKRDDHKAETRSTWWLRGMFYKATLPQQDP